MVEKKDAIPDTPYSWLRTREFEGTLHEGPEIGVWGINYNRVCKFCGFMEEPISTGLWPSPTIPSGLDGDDRLFEIPYYRKIYSFDDCMVAMRNQMSVIASFYVTQKWANPFEGRLDFEQSQDEVIGGHAMDMVPPAVPIPAPLEWDMNDYFLSQNTWGNKWGNYGFAAIKREFFEKNMYEAWAVSRNLHLPKVEGAGIVVVSNIIEMDPIRQHHMIEFRDLDTRKPIAWTFFSIRNMHVYVEDLFVVPGFRCRGFGTQLLMRIRAITNNLIPKFWIPFADIDTPQSKNSLQKWMEKRGVYFHNTKYKFAAYVGKPEKNDVGLQEIYIPPKPAYCLPVEKQKTGIVSGLHDAARTIQEKYSVSDEFRVVAEELFETNRELLARLAK